MKKIILFILIVALAALSFGCGQTEKKDESGLSVVCTIFPPYDFVTNVGGEHVSVTQLLPAGAESHSYEPTPKDIIAITNADLFIYVGGVNDYWAGETLASLGGEAPRSLALLDCVEVVEEELVEGMQHEEEEHDHDGDAIEYDEHVWTDPKNAIKIVNAIRDELMELDAGHKDAFTASAAAYCEKLTALDAAFLEAVEGAARKTIVFGDRFPFRYMAKAYGLKYYAAFPGCSTEVEPSAQTIAFLIDKVKSEDIPVVFYIEFSNHQVADAIAEAGGARTLLLHSCHNISKEERESGITYLSLMEMNLENLKEALKP